ncbi:hypothetical protein ACSBR2_025174 [Camellia fascicularis]
MAESSISVGIAENEVRTLKAALCDQQHLLQKLYNELDVEREASSTAASEALSMILRLQGEKAAMKMEANQYKRLAEEKMCHAEEALAIFEDLIYQKEMEIASLEYQVQAYKYKLLSLGCSDIGVCETKFPENLLQRNENLVGEAQNSLRRNSMPSIQFKISYQKKGSGEKERSPSPDIIAKVVEENMNHEVSAQSSAMEKKLENSGVGDINSYWEQIRKLDERVREIADFTGDKSTNLRSGPRSGSLVSHSSLGSIMTKYGQVKRQENLLGNEAIANPSCSLNVLDVFEVPQTHENEKALILEGNEGFAKPVSVSPETVKSYVKDQTDWVKKMLSSTQQKTSSCRPSNWVAADCHLALPPPHPGTGVGGSHSKFQQLNRPEIIEVERHDARPETNDRGEEELKLLKEIQEQLNSIESEIRSLNPKKSHPPYEFPLLSITEAMLHFWL